MTGQTLGILIIEDDRGVRELLCRDLEARGCRVTATNNGPEGLQAIVLGRGERRRDAAARRLVAVA
jgi:CheY-like chemotaxis protein